MRIYIAAIIVALALAASTCAKADPGDLPGTLGCFDETARNFCGRAIVPAGLGGLNLRTRTVEAGAFPTGGLGLAVDLWARRWYTVTPGAAVAASAGSGAGNYANLALLVGVAKYVWVGALVHIDATLTEWKALAGVDPLALASLIGGR